MVKNKMCVVGPGSEIKLKYFLLQIQLNTRGQCWTVLNHRDATIPSFSHFLLPSLFAASLSLQSCHK